MKNREGLTFREWLRAANAFRQSGRKLVDSPELRHAWRNGEDPTEYAENPLGPSTTELVVGGVASVVLIGLGVTMVYQALNPAGTSTSDTLQNTAALAALAGVV
jgi:hypothetical protein